MELKTNRHAVDQLADVRAEIKALETREKELRDALLAPGADLSGDEFYGRVTNAVSNRLDMALLERTVGKAVVDACKKPSTTTTLRLIRRGEEA